MLINFLSLIISAGLVYVHWFKENFKSLFLTLKKKKRGKKNGVTDTQKIIKNRSKPGELMFLLLLLCEENQVWVRVCIFFVVVVCTANFFLQISILFLSRVKYIFKQYILKVGCGRTVHHIMQQMVHTGLERPETARLTRGHYGGSGPPYVGAPCSSSLPAG